MHLEEMHRSSPSPYRKKASILRCNRITHKTGLLLLTFFCCHFSLAFAVHARLCLPYKAKAGNALRAVLYVLKNFKISPAKIEHGDHHGDLRRDFFMRLFALKIGMSAFIYVSLKTATTPGGVPESSRYIGRRI